MMRKAALFTLLVSMMLAGACGMDDDTKTASQTAPVQQSAQQQLTPEQLGELGAQIAKNPDRADQLLGQHGLTRENFEQQIRDVTENPDASRRYAAAYKKAA